MARMAVEAVSASRAATATGAILREPLAVRGAQPDHDDRRDGDDPERLLADPEGQGRAEARSASVARAQGTRSSPARRRRRRQRRRRQKQTHRARVYTRERERARPPQQPGAVESLDGGRDRHCSRRRPRVQEVARIGEDGATGRTQSEAATATPSATEGPPSATAAMAMPAGGHTISVPPSAEDTTRLAAPTTKYASAVRNAGCRPGRIVRYLLSRLFVPIVGYGPPDRSRNLGRR